MYVLQTRGLNLIVELILCLEIMLLATFTNTKNAKKHILGPSWRLRNLLGAKLLEYTSDWLRTSLVTKSPDFILYT